MSGLHRGMSDVGPVLTGSVDHTWPSLFVPPLQWAWHVASFQGSCPTKEDLSFSLCAQEQLYNGTYTWLEELFRQTTRVEDGLTYWRHKVTRRPGPNSLFFFTKVHYTYINTRWVEPLTTFLEFWENRFEPSKDHCIDGNYNDFKEREDTHFLCKYSKVTVLTTYSY